MERSIKSIVFYCLIILVAFSANLINSKKVVKPAENHHHHLNQTATNQTYTAIASFNDTKYNLSGVFTFTQTDNGTSVHIRVQGLPPKSSHAMHIHQFGDFSRGCESFGDHYNPLQKHHGGHTGSSRHLGDMGNLFSDENGVAVEEWMDTSIKITGPFSILGRGVVLHQNQDDLKSLDPTGHSGERIACAVIGWAQKKK